MKNVYKLETIYSIESHTLGESATIYELIENAANAFTHWVFPRLNKRHSIHVLCGKGNNGADGLLVANKLANYGFSVVVITIKHDAKPNPVNHHFREKIRYRKDIEFRLIHSMNDLILPSQNVVLIDALLGIGTDRKLKDFYAQLVSFCNEHYREIFAIDCPSGLLASGQKTEFAIQAEQTLTFQFPKHSFFAAENEKYVGRWNVRDVGLIEPEAVKTTSSYRLVEQKDIDKIWMSRSDFSHKGLMGRALFIMINSNMLGASLLAGRTCFSIGAGLVYGYCDPEMVSPLSLKEPQIIFNHKDLDSKLDISNAVCIGPGLGQDSNSVELVDYVLKKEPPGLIIDADAINIIAKKGWQDRVPNNAILTPHIKEFERLFGTYDGHQERITAQRKFAKQYKIYIILKGRYTSTADPEGHIYYNQTGNAALAKGGSGDVLAGIITALICQNYPKLQACLASVWIHGQAADLFVHDYDEKTLTPEKLIKYLPYTLRKKEL